MDKVLGDLKWKCVMAYIDDFIIYSKTFEEHLNHLEAVFKKLQEFGIFAKITKCRFGLPDLEFLGHVVSKDGVKADPKKISAVRELPTPTDVEAVRRFLGMAGFYRKYVKDFSARTEELRNLTKKSVEFKWTKECESEFNDIKNALVSSPVMAYPDFDKEFKLETDASVKGLGAILSQSYPNGDRVIAYASRSLNEHEKRYGITKMEALAVVWATDLFKVYLQDHPFVLVTDHKALLKFHELKDTNPTLERWSIKLSQYNYRVTYRPGPKHENADCLSRSIGIITVDQIIEEQRKDDLLGKWFMKFDEMQIIHPLGGQERELEMGSESVVLKEDGRLWRRKKVNGKQVDRLCIPRSIIPNILSFTASSTVHFVA